MTRRNPYTTSKINDLGSIAGQTRDQSHGPQSDLLIQLPFGHSLEIGDSASGPTVIDLDPFN